MPGSLSEYWKKRDFGVTSEPEGEVERTGKRRSFVIQKHAATRLHYDFRLELDGTLVSWAVPKGPSYDPKVRRMAVHVEDHPLSYASFEGTIPKGQYGAGTVIVWDRGTWEPVDDPVEGYRKGKLKFDMFGEKMHGRWNLVRINSRKDERQEPWLLIKEDDEEARPGYDVVEERPESVLTGTMPVKGVRGKSARGRSARGESARGESAGPGSAEIKPDQEVRSGKLESEAHGSLSSSRLTPRRSTPRRSTPRASAPRGAVEAPLPLFLSPQLATLVSEPPHGEGWVYELKFDGYRIVARVDGDEVRLFTRNGNDWTSKMRSLADEIRKLELASAWLDGEIVVLNDRGHPDFQALQNAFDNARTRDILYFVFDLPYFDGHDLTRMPLVQRRELLRAIFERNPSERLRFSEAFEVPVQKLLDTACRKGIEGLIGKRADAPYASTRSASWIKLKCTKRQEFVIGGYTDPKGSRVGFGSLLLGVHDAEGNLRYAGSVGTGFDDASLRSLLAKLEALGTDKVPFHEKPRDVKGHWVRPKLIAEVVFTEWTGDGRIRHPVFHGLRTDKDPQAITREQERPVEAVEEAAAEADDTPLKVTHGERVVDAKSEATKLDVVHYYNRIAPYMLPHLVGRPIALVRAPTGIAGELFFQKHGEKIRIPGIKQLPRSYWPGHPAMLEVATRETLVGAAQMNVIELHTWNSTTADISHPDRVIFDLDPGEGISWETLKEATALMKKMLDLLGLAGFLKTSGGKGLHVVVPLTPSEEWGYDAVKDVSEEIVKHMSRTLPQLFVAKSGARNRVGRIFVDFLRNGKGATTICAFSLRARPGLGVSVPITWKELAGLEAANQWHIFNVEERLKKLKRDPWKDYATTRQTLDEAAARLRT